MRKCLDIDWTGLRWSLGTRNRLGFSNSTSVHHIHLDFCQPFSSGGNSLKMGLSTAPQGDSSDVLLQAHARQEQIASRLWPHFLPAKKQRASGRHLTQIRPPHQDKKQYRPETQVVLTSGPAGTGQSCLSSLSFGKSKSLRSGRNKIASPKYKKTSRL